MKLCGIAGPLDFVGGSVYFKLKTFTATCHVGICLKGLISLQGPAGTRRIRSVGAVIVHWHYIRDRQDEGFALFFVPEFVFMTF